MTVMLTLVLGLAVGSLYLWRKLQPGFAVNGRERALKLIDAMPLGATGKLAVVEFDGRRILISISRGRIEKIAESSIDTVFVMPDED